MSDRMYGPIKLGGPCSLCGIAHPGQTCDEYHHKQDADPHAKCAAEIARLMAELVRMKNRLSQGTAEMKVITPPNHGEMVPKKDYDALLDRIMAANAKLLELSQDALLIAHKTRNDAHERRVAKDYDAQTADIAKYGRHLPGCWANDWPVKACNCGWDEIEARLQSKGE